MNNLRKIGLICLASILGLGACSSKVTVYQYQYESRLDEVFVKKDVDFTRYRAVIVEDVDVWYPKEASPTPQNQKKAEANLAKARHLFRETIRDALSEHYQVTDEAGKDVLRFIAEFVDLRSIPADGKLPAELDRYEFETKPGHITMVARLLDSKSGDVLARVADLGKKESAGGDGVVDWNAIGHDFEYWAGIFREWMDQVHGQQ
jgi:hypothetical protein